MDKNKERYRQNRMKCILTLLISTAIMTILAVMIIREVVRLGETASDSAYSVFKYFTTVSNILAAYSAILTVPFALDGLFNKKYNVSTYITKLLFCGTICVTITMLLALLVLWPMNGEDAVTGYNFWCHIVCPLLVISLYVLAAGEKPIHIRDCFFASIPVLLYGIIYVIMVEVIGEERGGWTDMYGVRPVMPIALAAIAVQAVVLLIAFCFRAIHNKSARRRWKKMVDRIIQHYKPEDGTDVRFMLYEMGELMGGYDGQYEMVVPVQLLQILSERYTELELEDMVRIYVKGALNQIKGTSD